LIDNRHGGELIAIVISHDCDIARGQDKEPSIEVIVGRRIEKLGTDGYGKTARRLHVQLESSNGPIIVELVATAKRTVAKRNLADRSPRTDLSFSSENKNVLQLWLATRYRRSAFANEFDAHLKDRSLRRQLGKIFAESGEEIRAVYFDVDGGNLVHRPDAADPFQLNIVLLYDGRKSPHTADVVDKAAEKIEAAFADAFLKDGTWRGIQLLSCIAISDEVMTVAQSQLLQRWNLDHLSLEDDPPQAMLSE